jgi:hypothetical protein
VSRRIKYTPTYIHAQTIELEVSVSVKLCRAQ